jgi:hypothetical protein
MRTAGELTAQGAGTLEPMPRYQGGSIGAYGALRGKLYVNLVGYASKQGASLVIVDAVAQPLG